MATNTIVCNVCGFDFTPLLSKHYVSRDDGKTGLATAFQSTETAIYDTFDCPACGCQKVVQARKRKFYPWNDNNDDSVIEKEPEEEESDE